MGPLVVSRVFIHQNHAIHPRDFSANKSVTKGSHQQQMT